MDDGSLDLVTMTPKNAYARVISIAHVCISMAFRFGIAPWISFVGSELARRRHFCARVVRSKAAWGIEDCASVLAVQCSARWMGATSLVRV